MEKSNNIWLGFLYGHNGKTACSSRIGGFVFVLLWGEFEVSPSENLIDMFKTIPQSLVNAGLLIINNHDFYLFLSLNLLSYLIHSKIGSNWVICRCVKFTGRYLEDLNASLIQLFWRCLPINYGYNCNIYNYWIVDQIIKLKISLIHIWRYIQRHVVICIIELNI